jgi:hypothetical protein
MNRFFLAVASVLVGASMTWFFLQPSFAHEAALDATTVAPGLRCVTRVGPARLTMGDRCYRDEVMVGQRDDYIYCANLEVACN